MAWIPMFIKSHRIVVICVVSVFITSVLLLSWLPILSSFHLNWAIQSTEKPRTTSGYFEKATKYINYSEPPTLDSIVFRRDITQQLLEVSEELKAYSIRHATALKLRGVISQLDIRYKLGVNDLNEIHNGTQTSVADDADTCGEVYLERIQRMGPFVESKGVTEDPHCDERKKRTPISDLVTVLLISNNSNVRRVIRGVKDYDNRIPVILAYDDYKTVRTAVKFSHVQPLEYKTIDLQNPGCLWNKMAHKVTTPYMLIGRDLSHFTRYVFLKRLVHWLAKSSPVGVSAGATRNLTGHWKLGCHQSEVKNYYLRYAEGYRLSLEDCIFCDHISGPFMVKTALIRQIPLNEKLPAEVVFEDWFLKLKQAGILTVNCPDVMFFIHGHIIDDITLKRDYRDSWLSLAKEWSITRVFIPPDIDYMFTCGELSFNCDPWFWGMKFYLVPTCCLEQVAKTLREIEAFALETGMEYELDSGSQLSAVKLQGHFPWDLKGDIRYNESFFDTFIEHKAVFAKVNITLEFDGDSKKFKIFTPDFYIEMWNATMMKTKQFLPPDIRHIPTLMNVLGVWVRGTPNPGLYARNNYGPHHFKHALFHGFNHTGMNDEYTNASSWLPCPQEQFHGCLDLISPDGNLCLTPHYFENLGLAWDRLQ